MRDLLDAVLAGANHEEIMGTDVTDRPDLRPASSAPAVGAVKSPRLPARGYLTTAPDATRDAIPTECRLRQSALSFGAAHPAAVSGPQDNASATPSATSTRGRCGP